MPIIFPTSPIVGQVFTSGGRSWVWSGATWDSPTATNTLLAPYGLELVKTQTIGTAVTSVTVNDAFSATYDNYKILISGSNGAAQNTAIFLTYNNSSGSSYNFGLFFVQFATGATGTAAAVNSSGGIRVAATGVSQNTNASFDILNPFLPISTTNHGSFINQGSAWISNGSDTNFASHTGFTLTTTTTLTGGTIAVYGYRKA